MTKYSDKRNRLFPAHQGKEADMCEKMGFKWRPGHPYWNLITEFTTMRMTEEQFAILSVVILRPAIMESSNKFYRSMMVLVALRLYSDWFRKYVSDGVATRHFVKELLFYILLFHSTEEEYKSLLPYMKNCLSLVPVVTWVEHMTYPLLLEMERNKTERNTEILRQIRQGLHDRAAKQQDWYLMMDFMCETVPDIYV